MIIQSHKINDTEVAEIISEEIIIHNVDDAMNLLGYVYFQGFDKMIIHQRNLTADFFDLKNKMAGEILQKFSNYRIRLAIVGDFSTFSSKSLNDFIYESNKRKHINFINSVNEALSVLRK